MDGLESAARRSHAHAFRSAADKPGRDSINRKQARCAARISGDRTVIALQAVNLEAREVKARIAIEGVPKDAKVTISQITGALNDVNTAQLPTRIARHNVEAPIG